MPSAQKTKSTKKAINTAIKVTKKNSSSKSRITARAVRQPTGFVTYYGDTLGLVVKTKADLIEQIRGGLKVTAFAQLAHVLNLSDSELANFVNIPTRTLNRRKKAGRLEANESDRLVRVASLFAQAVELFEGDNNRAAEWFRTSKKALGGASPLEFSDTEIGVKEVEGLIGRLEYGVFS